MNDIAEIARTFVPGVGIWTLVLMGLAYGLREWRETRKLSFEDRIARREGYAKQVEDLQRENRQLREDVARAWHDHEEYRRLCHAETDQLREEVQRLSNEVTGLKRALMGGQVAAARTLPPEALSPAVEAAAERAAEIIEKRGECE